MNISWSKRNWKLHYLLEIILGGWKIFPFNNCFHFLGLNWSLTDKAHNFGQKQLIFNKYFNLDLHPLCRRRESAKKYIFASWHWAKFPLLLNKISFQTNKANVQKRRNIKICCDLSDLSAQPIDEIYLFFKTRWKIFMQSLTNAIIH